MNPILVLIVILGAITLWFLLSFVFAPLGKVVYKIWKEAVDEVNKEEGDIKETCKKEKSEQ